MRLRRFEVLGLRLLQMMMGTFEMMKDLVLAMPSLGNNVDKRMAIE